MAFYYLFSIDNGYHHAISDKIYVYDTKTCGD